MSFLITAGCQLTALSVVPYDDVIMRSPTRPSQPGEGDEMLQSLESGFPLQTQELVTDEGIETIHRIYDFFEQSFPDPTTEPRSSETSTSTATMSGFIQFRPNFDFPQNSLVDGKVWQQRQNIFIDFVEDMSSTEPLFNSPTTQFIDLSSLNQFDVFQRASEIVSQVQVNQGNHGLISLVIYLIWNPLSLENRTRVNLLS